MGVTKDLIVHVQHVFDIFNGVGTGVTVTTTEICFTLLHFSRTNTQQKSTHAGGIASRVTMRPLE
jgi:hypothetical protein